jgi:3-deoxy-D-manno-octulosonate 8-phosphate phosphatase (KDO 8-P phosphatase)
MERAIRTPAREELEARAAAVRLIVFDVDGVLTDGGLYYGPDGEAMKRFDVRDGHGIVMARLVGLPCALITARRSSAVDVRARELGIAAVKQGRREKVDALEEILRDLSILPEACAYMGDDLNDLAPMSLVRLPACPSDAAPEVRARALFVAHQAGGRGAARELIELCLKASGLWATALEHQIHPPGQVSPG